MPGLLLVYAVGLHGLFYSSFTIEALRYAVKLQFWFV